MCGTCGCEKSNEVRIYKPGEAHPHEFVHEHEHHHEGVAHSHHHHHQYSHTHHQDEHGHSHESHDHGEHHHSHDSRELIIEKNILNKNNLLAERNRGYFEAKQIIALNLVSSPGSGKTSLLEKTIKEIGNQISISVIEGDQQTVNDAKRIESAGAPVIQVNTGNGCHLDSEMINKALQKLHPSEKSLLFIENVGNLVCPSLFDLGESKRVVIISVTEGEDKPVKYPNIFESADLCIINKTDLLPYVDFSVEAARNYALQVNPDLEFLELSVTSGEGMKSWYTWLNGIMQL